MLEFAQDYLVYMAFMPIWYVVKNSPLFNELYFIYLNSMSLQSFILLSIGVLTFVTFFSASLFYAIFDFSSPDSVIGRIAAKYKIQSQYQPSLKDYIKVMKLVLTNQITVNIPFGLLVFYPLFQYRGCLYDILPMELPLSYILLHLTGFLLLEELGFFYSHLLLHKPFFYKNIHKLHHQFTAPIGLAAVYAHPIEHALSNLFPLILGPLILRSHIFVIWIWFFLGITNTTNSHSGYAFPGFPSSLPHDFHHSNYNNCYGVLGVLDWLHGTDKQFKIHLEQLKIKDKSQ